MNTNTAHKARRRAGLAAAALGTGALVATILGPVAAVASAPGTQPLATQAGFAAPTKVSGSKVVSVGAWHNHKRRVVLTKGTRVPAAGKVIMVGSGPKTENGLLAKLVTVTHATNGQVILTTKQAAIQAALPTGSYPFHTGEGDAQFSVAGRPNPAAVNSDGNSSTFPLNFNWGCTPKVKNVHTDGHLTLNASLTGHAVIRPGFMGIDGTLHIADDAALHAVLDAAVDCKLKFVVADARFPLEGIGIPGSLNVQVSLDVGAVLNGHLEVGVQHHFGVTRTIEWHTGESQVQVFDGLTDNRGFNFDKPQLSGDAKLEAGLNLDVGVNLLEILTPHVNLRGYVGVKANTSIAPWWTAYDGMKGTAGIKLFGAELANPPLELFKSEHVIAQAVDVQPLTSPQSNAAAGAQYATRLDGIGGGGGPYRFELASGSLPPGLNLTPEGMISGTPDKVGGQKRFPFQIRVTDASGQAADRLRDAAITVHDGPVASNVTIFGTEGAMVTKQLTAVGNSKLHWSPSSPYPGFTLTDDGLLTGVMPGASVFTVAVTDESGASTNIHVTLRDMHIDPPGDICTNPRLPDC